MKHRAVRSRERGDRGQWLQYTGLVIGKHDRDERRARITRQKIVECLENNDAVAVDRDVLGFGYGPEDRIGSTAETRTRCRPQPSKARWFASVPPLTKITPSGGAPSNAPTAERALSTACRAARPQRWTEEGLPHRASMADMAAAAAGRNGAVAFQSR